MEKENKITTVEGLQAAFAQHTLMAHPITNDDGRPSSMGSIMTDCNTCSDFKKRLDTVGVVIADIPPMK